MLLRPFFLTLLATGCLAGALSRADDFHIESKLFIGGEEEPASQNTTLFHSGMVYDYLSEPAEVTVFDGVRGRFVLLDPVRHVRTEVSTRDVEQFIQKLQTWASNHKDEFLKFLADPQFEDQENSNAEKLSFRSPWLSYEITTEPARNAESARQYGDFCDWYARLNTMTNPALLPFARLKVNAELRQRQRIPSEVQLTINGNNRLPRPQGEPTFRTEHNVTWRLSKSDLQQIERTGEDLVTFSPVGFQQYRRSLDEQASR